MEEKHEFLELYKLHVEMIDRISQRRSNLNQFYVAVLSGLLGGIAIITDKNEQVAAHLPITFILVGTLGCISCVTWRLNLSSYKILNSAKFKVLTQIESQLKIGFYKEEWSILQKNNRFKGLTWYELIVPVIYFIPFFILIIWGCLNIKAL